MEVSDKVGAKVGAAMLGAAGPILNLWSLGLAVVAFLVLALGLPGVPATLALLLSIALALVELGFAARCAFDADLFSRLAGEEGSFGQLDKVLRDLGLRAGARKDRPIGDRLRGALRLLKIQAGLCVVQTVAMLSVPFLSA